MFGHLFSQNFSASHIEYIRNYCHNFNDIFFYTFNISKAKKQKTNQLVRQELLYPFVNAGSGVHNSIQIFCQFIFIFFLYC